MLCSQAFGNCPEVDEAVTYFWENTVFGFLFEMYRREIRHFDGTPEFVREDSPLSRQRDMYLFHRR